MRQLCWSRNTPEQRVVLKYRNFPLSFAMVQNFILKLGYFIIQIAASQLSS